MSFPAEDGTSLLGVGLSVSCTLLFLARWVRMEQSRLIGVGPLSSTVCGPSGCCVSLEVHLWIRWILVEVSTRGVLPLLLEAGNTFVLSL